MDSYAFSESEKTQCVLRSAEDHESQPFKRGFEQSTESQHHPALAFEEDTKNIEEEEIILTVVEMVAHNYVRTTKDRIPSMFTEDSTLSMTNAPF